MAKRIEITIVESGVTAIAELYEDDAPQTCAAMWKILEKPIERRARHSIWCGRKITVDVPEANRVVDPEAIPLENSTVFPSGGDLLWNYWPPQAVRGFPEGVWDLMMIYGPEAIMKGPLGQESCHLWAHITEGFDAFASECNQFRITGTKTIRLRRLKD